MPTGKAYEWWDCHVTEDRDDGVIQCAVAGDSEEDEAEFVQWSSPKTERVVRFTAACRGVAPTVPAARALPGGGRLLRSSVSMSVPVPLPTGGYMWIVWGEHRYGLVKARPVDGDVPIGNFPRDYDGRSPSHVMPGAAFQGMVPPPRQ